MTPPVSPEPLTVKANCAPPEFADAGAGAVMELRCGPLNVKLFRCRSQAPRPCVAARRVRDGSCSFNDNTATRGNPLLNVVQVHGVTKQFPMNTPRSVAAYSVPGTSGSTTTSFTGRLGRSVAAGFEQSATEQLTSIQGDKNPALAKICPIGSLTLALLFTYEKPEDATYTVPPVTSAGSTATAVIARGVIATGVKFAKLPGVTPVAMNRLPAVEPA